MKILLIVLSSFVTLGGLVLIVAQTPVKAIMVFEW